MNLRLRAAESEDAAAVADILISARSTFMPYAPSAHPDPELRAWVREHLVPSGGVLVAVDEEAVVGVIATSNVGGVHWIDQMMVMPAHVGHGIGSKLPGSALTALPRPVRLYSFQANTGARRFYERRGFVAIAFTDGAANEEHCPDVLYELSAPEPHGV